MVMRIPVMRILNLIKQFEMKEAKSVKNFSNLISKIVNQVLGEAFPDSRIMKKVLVSLPKKFEQKNFFLENKRFLEKKRLRTLIGEIKKEKEKNNERLIIK